MRTTRDRIDNSYFKPQNDEEWKRTFEILRKQGTIYENENNVKLYWDQELKAHFIHKDGRIDIDYGKKNQEEISLDNMLDLLSDKVFSTWRLKDDWFNPFGNSMIRSLSGRVFMEVNDEGLSLRKGAEELPTNATVYSDLITLYNLFA